MTLPSRRSRILRIEPDGLGPPAATTAESSVDWLDSVITPGPLRRADDEDAQAAQLAERDREVEVVVEARELRAQVLLEVGGLDAGDVEAAHLGQVEHAVAVDRAAVVDVDRAPGAGHDLVAGADRVVGRDRHVVERLEVVGGVGEEGRAEDRQQPAGRRLRRSAGTRSASAPAPARRGAGRCRSDRGRCAGRRCRSRAPGRCPGPGGCALLPGPGAGATPGIALRTGVPRG